MSSELPPLPYGWIEQFDPNSNHPFYVDTKADPVRRIWVHPYEDEQYLLEHPDVKEKVGSIDRGQESPASKPRRHSFNGLESDSVVKDADNAPRVSSKKGKEKEKEKRGFFGKLKDKAIGTKEEREALKKERARAEAEARRQQIELLKAKRAQYEAQQALYNQQYYQGGPPPPQYLPPAGNPYAAYGPGYGSGYGYGYGDYRRGGPSTSSALPFLGALAGGLLLGDILTGF
ncbi:hypothetical protein F5148DRAFT_1158264 [Russula earlei]|uniref:Uncharacterized protein n=1 Tax=Russula earlei TaxID=71964 RepID=A0ACC0UNH0_9AGAM|nr:hypothetical protein F5148DRAFT_1158264 [Russula earlei]